MERRSSMEYLHAWYSCGFGNALDFSAFFVGTGVTLCRHDYRKSGLIAPTQIYRIEYTIVRGNKCGQQIRFQPKHQHLAFRVTKAAIVFDELGAFLGDN